MSVDAAPRRTKLRWFLWTVFLFAAVFLLFAAWALGTSNGARWLINRADAAMPARLSVGELDGSVLQGLRIGGLRFEDDGVRLDAQRLEVALEVLPLLARRVYIERIFVDGAKLTLWPSKKADEPYLAMQLPVRLRLDEVLAKDLVIDGLRSEPILLDTLAFAGTWVGTHVELERLVVNAPNGRLAFAGDIDLANLLAIRGSGTLNWQADGLAWRAAIATRKHSAGTGVGLAMTAPLQIKVTALLAGTHDTPRWQARVQMPLQRLPRQLTGGEPTPVALDLRGGGVGFDATLHGTGQYADEPFALTQGRLRSTRATVFVDALEIRLPKRDARIAVHGKVDRAGKRPDADLRIDIEQLPFPQAEDAEGAPTILTGGADVRGWIERYSATTDLTAVRDKLRATLKAKFDGTPERIAVESSRVDSGQGALALSGVVGLAPGSAWKLQGSAAGFDPSVFAAEWPGAIDARLVFDGKRGTTQTIGTLTVDKLGGTLRDRPIAGSAAIEFGERGRFAGQGDLRSGASTLSFVKSGLDDARLALDLDIVSLGDLLPAARGRIVGDLIVDIDATPYSIDGHLEASDVGAAGFSVGSLTLEAVAPRGGRAGNIALLASAIAVERLRIDRVALDASGTLARHDASLSVDSAELDLRVRASGAYVDRTWRGQLTAFDLAPEGLDAWSLRAPVAVVASAEALDIADPGVCVTASGRDSCVDVDYAKGGDLAVAWSIDRLPSAVIARALELAGMASFEIDSELSSTGALARKGEGPLRGQGSATLSDGRIVVRRALEPVVIAVSDLRVDVNADAQGLRARVGGTIGESGRLGGDVTLGPELAAASSLSGQVAIEFSELAWLESLSADIAAPRGTFDGRFTLDGTIGEPRFSGEAHLADFFVEIPEYNVRLREADVRVTANADRTLAIAGTVLSGRDGRAAIAGTINPDAREGERLRLRITGDNFLAANRPDLMLRVSPDVTISIGAERIDVEGTVAVPRARIDLSRLEGGSRKSGDVVVIDDPVVERRDLPVWTDLNVIAGGDVDLEGFGLDGNVSGSLRVRNRPGREATGQGTLNVTGKYEAYGQRLDIVRGRVVFNRTPLDNPQLDVRATRRVGTVTVGVRVSGTALAPDSEVYSSPRMDQSDALAYLIVGRPLRSASAADAGAIANAAGSLGGASGDLLSSSLGARMGLGDLGEPTAAFTMGRWLSPRLYLSYGFSGLDAEPVFSLRYLIREWLEIETVVGSEVRAGVNYRRER